MNKRLPWGSLSAAHRARSTIFRKVELATLLIAIIQMSEDSQPTVEHQAIDVRCVHCRIPHTAESLRLLRGAGWHQREDGSWICPRCSTRLARAS